MQLGRVIGTLVATRKHTKLEGAKLLLVQPLTLDDRPRGTPLLTIDSVGAGVGEKVLIVGAWRSRQSSLRSMWAMNIPSFAGPYRTFIADFRVRNQRQE